MKKIKDPTLFKKIRQFLTEYMPIIKRESENTVIAYRYTLNLYLAFLQSLLAKGLNSITSADFNQKNILAFMDWLRSNRGNKVSTANLRLVHMRRFCRFLMEENVLLLSELSAIQKIETFPKEYANGIKYLTIPEMRLVLAQPDPGKKVGLRDRFFMYLLYDSGCRIQEILDLTIRDFSVNSGGARLHIIGKGNKFRATPISEELIPMYEEYCVCFHKTGNLDDHLFYTKRNGITTKMSCDNANVIKLSPQRAKTRRPRPFCRNGRGAFFRRFQPTKGHPRPPQTRQAGIFSKTADICGKSPCNSSWHRLECRCRKHNCGRPQGVGSTPRPCTSD